MKLFKISIIVVGSIFVLLAAFFISVLLKTPELELDKLKYPDTTIIYDSNDQVLVNLGVEKRKYAAIDDISPNVLNALIATEDRKFYEHKGIDWMRFGYAILLNVKTLSFSEGASTITQQLIKNTHLNNIKTIRRKIQEMYLAYQLEQIIDKDYILELYLNSSPFGGTVYGIESASRYYFNKTNTELTLSESALLIGILQLPDVYNPYKHIDNALERRNLILKVMYENDYISLYEYQEAMSETIEDKLSNGLLSNNYEIYSDFIDYVIKEAKEKYDIDLYQGGVKVYTTLDPKIQASMYDSINSMNTYEGIESSAVTLDMNSEIKGIISSKRNDFALSLSYAFDVPLQVASTIKPILDYSPLIEHYDFSTGTPFLDEEIKYNDGQVVNNWDHNYKGLVTMRKALVESRNVPALKAYRLSNGLGYDIAENVGLIPENMRIEAHAIGGYTNGYTVLDMTEAYNIFPNEGIYKDSYAISKIVFQTGEEIINESVEKRVIKHSTAFMMTDMLIDVVNSFGYQGFVFPNMVVAGKTGQSNFPEHVRNDNNIPITAVKDLWFIGYSNQYTVGVWSGGKDLNNYINSKNNRLSRHIFRDIMLDINSTNSQIVSKPSNVMSVNIEIDNEELLLPSEDTPLRYIKNEYFIIGTAPNEISTKFFSLDKPETIDLSYEIKNELLSINWDEVEPLNDNLGEVRYEVCLVKNGKRNIIGNTTLNNMKLEIGIFSLLFYDEVVIKAMYTNTNDHASEYQVIRITISELL
ncbi:transglycosylase domain-containing protein [Mycoplasmatota bacterium zrk1]